MLYIVHIKGSIYKATNLGIILVGSFAGMKTIDHM